MPWSKRGIGPLPMWLNAWVYTESEAHTRLAGEQQGEGWQQRRVGRREAVQRTERHETRRSDGSGGGGSAWLDGDRVTRHQSGHQRVIWSP